MARIKCPGCGRWFNGERGLRSHQTSRFIAMGCRPIKPDNNSTKGNAP